MIRAAASSPPTRTLMFRLIASQGMLQVAIGVAIGLPLAFAVAQVLRGVLVDVSPADPVTFVGVVVLLACAGFLGCLIPARRATRVDPVTALRHE